MSICRSMASVLVLAVLIGCSSAGTDEGETWGDNSENPTGENPTGVTARGFTGYYDLGDHVALGEIVNGTDGPIADVTLRITYRSASGALVTTDGAASILGYVPRGATAPVLNMYYSAPPGIAKYDVEVTGWSDGNASIYRPVTILNVSARYGYFGIVVEGSGRNDTGRTLTGVKLITSFRNDTGGVVGVYSDYPLAHALAPDQSFDFTIETFDDSPEATSVLVQGEGSAGPP